MCLPPLRGKEAISFPDAIQHVLGKLFGNSCTREHALITYHRVYIIPLTDGLRGRKRLHVKLYSFALF